MTFGNKKLDIRGVLGHTNGHRILEEKTHE